MGNRCVWLEGELEDVERSVGVCDLEHRLDRQKNRTGHTEHNRYRVFKTTLSKKV